MSSESEQQSILEQLKHLIFDENKLISYKWVTNHFHLQIQTSKHLLSKFVDKHSNKLWIHYCITGYKASNTSHSDPIFAILIVSDKDLQTTKDSFNTITNTHIHSIAMKHAETMNDFYGAQYQADYEQQRDVMNSYLAPMQSALNIAAWSNITNNQVKRVSSPHLNRALSHTKQEQKQMNAHDTNKKQSFNQKIDRIKTKNKAQATPLKTKFNKLQIEKNEKKSNTNANSNNNNKQKGAIAECFAKAATKHIHSKSAINDVKKKKADDITNFFSKNNKKKSKPKKKKKKANKGSIQPAALKRMRGAMETGNNMAPIDYDSESSESEQMEVEFGVSDDEELMQITSRAKRRKIADSEDEDDDDDIDAEKDVNLKEKKQMEKQRKKEEKEKLLAQRKNNFFGKAAGNKLREKKKYKKIQKTHINAKGMFVTEDVLVSDEENEDCEEKDTVEVMHKHQHMVNDNMKEKKQTNNNKKACAPVVRRKTQKEKKAPKKNGIITSFFNKK